MNFRIVRDVLFLAASFTLITTKGLARSKHMATGEAPQPVLSNTIEFIENKGQWNAEAKFKASIPRQTGVVFLTDGGFVYNYASDEDLKRIHDLTHDAKNTIDLQNEVVRQHAYRVHFEGANKNIQYEQESKSSTYYNFFVGNDRSTWAGNVASYGRVLQKNIYKGIDVAVYGRSSSLKYDFIVKAGADPNQIVLGFSGVSPQLTSEGNLKITTSVNEVEEKAPYTYQIIEGREQIVASRYKLSNGKLSFEFPEGYDKRFDLIIDPELIFATYSGGTQAQNYSLSTTYDNMGSLYAGSYAYGLGWPVTDGAIQSTFGGGVDVAINKYGDSGKNLIYSTLYGGVLEDYAHAMIVNDDGELIIAGSTTSSNLATTDNCFSNTLRGGGDIFIVRFNATGTALLGATYIGGNTRDPVAFTFQSGPTFQMNNQNTISPVEVNFDKSGNIWVVGSTSSTDFPVTDDAKQKTIAGGQDGFIFKMDPTCSRLIYSSFLGGSSPDCISAIQFNNDDNVVVCGTTLSNNFPVTTGALNSSYRGGFSDGFVAIINAKDGTVMQATYVGTDKVDKAVNLQVDGGNNIYVLGETMGNYPISPDVYSTANGDVFIDKLSSDLSKSLLSTRVGTDQAQSIRYFPTAFLLDNCDNIYIAGLGGTDVSSGPGLPATLPITPDAFSSRADDFYFIVLKPSFSDILFGSYYGSRENDHTHCGVNRLDKDGKVYHSVCSAAQGVNKFPTTPGAFGPDKKTEGQDIVSFKFDFEASGVRSDFRLDPNVNGNDSGCVPYTIRFLSISKLAAGLVWDFGDGSAPTSEDNPTHTYTKTGTYTVTLYATNDTTCITADTSYMTITVLSTEKPDITVRDTVLCHFEQQINIGVHINVPSPNHVIAWGPATGILSDATKDTITVDPSANHIYYVRVVDTIPGVCGVASADTVHIDLSPRELKILNSDTTVCEGSVVHISAISTPGYTFRWTPATGVSDSTALEPDIRVYEPNVYTLTGSYPGCIDTTVSIDIGMQKNPGVNVGPDLRVCQGTEVALEATITPFRNDYTYAWTPDEKLNNAHTPNADLIADSSGVYHLEVRSPVGCVGRDSLRITVYPGGFGSISNDTSYCPPDEVPLLAEGGARYAWTPSYGLSDTSIANPLASPKTTTEYTVYITDIHGCVDTEFVSVEVHPAAMLVLPDSVSIYPGEAYQVEPGTNAVYFSWFPPSGVNNTEIANPLLSPEVRTRYFVQATTEYGCTIQDSIDILVNQTVIDMPNAFAPSGKNNLYKPSKRGIAQLTNFSIFNRWGNKVFSTTNIDEGWDGTSNGTPQPMGVYIYVVEAVTNTGRIFSQQGNVTLLR